MPETPPPPTTPNAAEHASEPESTPGEADPDSPEPLTPCSVALEVTFHLDTTDTNPPAAGWLESHLEKAARLCGVSSGSLSVTLIDDAEMVRLHGEYCDDPTTTDVLTFDLREPGQPASHLEGDLAVCRDESQRQAEGRGHDARTELLLYAVHGLLHLIGEDDRDPEAYERMHRREDELFAQLGFAAVFKSEAAIHNGPAGETR